MEAQRKRTIETLKKINSDNLVSTILVPNDNERSVADQWKQIVEQNKQRVIEFIFNHNTNFVDNTIAYDYIEIPHDLLSLVGASSISSVMSNKMSNKIHKILIVRDVSKFCETSSGRHWKKKRLRIGEFEFKLHLYPNGLTEIHHGFTAFFVELTKLPHDVQSIALFINLFCTETDTKYKETKLFHGIGDSQGWIWSLSTAQCQAYSALHFGAYLEILQIRYNHANKIEDLSTNIAINNINSYIWEWSDIRGILYEIKHNSHPHRSAFFSENTDDNMFCFVIESCGAMDNKHISIQCNLLRLPLGVEQITILFTANFGYPQYPNTTTLSYRSSVSSLKLIQEDVEWLLSTINPNGASHDSNDEVSLVLSVEILDQKTKETKAKKSRNKSRRQRSRKRRKAKLKYNHRFMECWLQLNECLDRYYKYNKKQLNDKWLEYIVEHQYNECLIPIIIANGHCNDIVHWKWELLHFDDEFPIDNTMDDVLISITQRERFISYILSYCYIHNKRPDQNEMEQAARSITNSDTEFMEIINAEMSLKIQQQALCTSESKIKQRQGSIEGEKQRLVQEEWNIDKMIKELRIKKEALKTKQKELAQQQRDICAMNKEHQEKKKELVLQQKQFEHNKERQLKQDKLSAKQRHYQVSQVRDEIKKQNELKFKIHNELNDYFVKKIVHQNGNIDDEDIKHMMDGVADGIDHEDNMYNYDEWFTEHDSTKRNGFGNSWVCNKCEFVNDKIMIDGEWRYNNMRTDCALCGYVREEYANGTNHLWREAPHGQIIEDDENDEDAYELIKRMENIADDILREPMHEDTLPIDTKNGYTKVCDLEPCKPEDDEIKRVNAIPAAIKWAAAHDLGVSIQTVRGLHDRDNIANSAPVVSSIALSGDTVSNKQNIPRVDGKAQDLIWNKKESVAKTGKQDKNINTMKNTHNTKEINNVSQAHETKGNKSNTTETKENKKGKQKNPQQTNKLKKRKNKQDLVMTPRVDEEVLDKDKNINKMKNTHDIEAINVSQVNTTETKEQENKNSSQNTKAAQQTNKPKKSKNKQDLIKMQRVDDEAQNLMWKKPCISLHVLSQFLQNISITQKENVWNKHAVNTSNGAHIPNNKLLDTLCTLLSLFCEEIDSKPLNKDDAKKILSPVVSNIVQRMDNPNGMSLNQFNHELYGWIAEGIKKETHVSMQPETKQPKSRLNEDAVQESIDVKIKRSALENNKNEHEYASNDASILNKNVSNAEHASSEPEKSADTTAETDDVNKKESDNDSTLTVKDASGDKQNKNDNKIENRHDIKAVNNVSQVQETRSNKSIATETKENKNKKAKQKNAQQTNKPKKSKNKQDSKAVKSSKSSKSQKTQHTKAKRRKKSPEQKEKKAKNTKPKNTTKKSEKTQDAKDKKLKRNKSSIGSKITKDTKSKSVSSINNAVDLCIRSHSNPIPLSKIKQMDVALARYYAHKSRTYWNADGTGKFYEFCDENGYDTDGVLEEFEEDPAECLLVEFDENFPTNKKGPERFIEIFCIIKHCWDDPQAFMSSAKLPKRKPKESAADSNKKQKQPFTKFENIVFGDMIKLYHIAQKLKHMDGAPSSPKTTPSTVALTTNHDKVDKAENKCAPEPEPPKSHCAKIMDLVIGAVPSFQSQTNSKVDGLQAHDTKDTKEKENEKKKTEQPDLKPPALKKEDNEQREKERVESEPEEEDQEALETEQWEPEEAEMLCFKAEAAVHSTWNKEQYGMLIREREEFLKQYDMKWTETIHSSAEFDEKCMDLQRAIVHDYTKKEIECLLTIEIIHKHFIHLTELKQRWSEIEATLRVMNRKDLRLQMMGHLDFFVRIEQDMMKRKSFESLQSEVVMFMINVKSTKTECEKCIQYLDEIEKINDKVMERHERKKRFHQQFRNLNLYQKKSSGKQKKKTKEKETKESTQSTTNNKDNNKHYKDGVMQILDEIRTDRLNANIREIVKEDRFRIEIDDGFVNIHSGTRYVGEKCHIEQFYFNLYLYPNGRSRSEKGYVQFVIKFEIPPHIKSMVIYCKFFEKKTSTEYNTTEMIERGNGAHIAWDPYLLSTKNCIKHKQLLFGYRIQIIQIHHCINNKITDHCKDKVFGDGIYRWEMDKTIVSFIKQNIGRNPILFYIQHPTKKCISFSFKANPSRKIIYLSLNLFKLPPKIEKIKLLLQITSSCNKKVGIKKEREHIFDYKHTQLTVELTKKQTDALLAVAKQQKLCLIFKINIKQVWFREFMEHPWCLEKFFGTNGDREQNDPKCSDSKSQTTKNANTTTRNNSNKYRNNKKRNSKKRNVSKSNRKK